MSPARIGILGPGCSERHRPAGGGQSAPRDRSPQVVTVRKDQPRGLIGHQFKVVVSRIDTANDQTPTGCSAVHWQPRRAQKTNPRGVDAAVSPTSRSSRRMGTVLVAGVQPRSMSEKPVRSSGCFSVDLPAARMIRCERNRAHVHRERHTDAARTRRPFAVAGGRRSRCGTDRRRGVARRDHVCGTVPLSISHAVLAARQRRAVPEDVAHERTAGHEEQVLARRGFRPSSPCRPTGSNVVESPTQPIRHRSPSGPAERSGRERRDRHPRPRQDFAVRNCVRAVRGRLVPRQKGEQRPGGADAGHRPLARELEAEPSPNAFFAERKAL